MQREREGEKETLRDADNVVEMVNFDSVWQFTISNIAHRFTSKLMVDSLHRSESGHGWTHHPNSECTKPRKIERYEMIATCMCKCVSRRTNKMILPSWEYKCTCTLHIDTLKHIRHPAEKLQHFMKIDKNEISRIPICIYMHSFSLSCHWLKIICLELLQCIALSFSLSLFLSFDCLFVLLQLFQFLLTFAPFSLHIQYPHDVFNFISLKAGFCSF